MRIMSFSFLLATLLFNLSSHGAGNEVSNSFVITIFPDHIRVLSPKEKNTTVGLRLENKSLTKMVGKVSTDDKDLRFISIMPQKSNVIEIKTKTLNHLYFYPMSPPGQRVELVFGRSSYEIPTKKK